MSKSRWIVTCLALFGLCGLSVGIPTDKACGMPNGEKEAVVWPVEVAEALAALDVPSPPRGHINEPFSSVPTKAFQPFDYYDDCADAIDLLSKTAFDVDSDLLHLAESDKPLPTRYRAVLILIRRKNPAVAQVLQSMGFADDALERYVAWKAYRDAIDQKQLPLPSDYSDILVLYANEQDHEVRDQLAMFLGTARARAAVPVLIERLRSDPGDCQAIWTLGMIGDPRAVPAVIADFEKYDLNRHVHCDALGKLATPEAVDFLIAHLDQYGAAEALGEAKNTKALPALKRHLDKLARAKKRNELAFAAAKVAITQLSYQNPAPHLLVLAEDRSNNDGLRNDALTALRAYETTDLHARLLRVFRDDPDLGVKMSCVWLLKDSSLEGLTEALIERALACEPATYLGGLGLEAVLLDELNKRLGYSCRTFSALQERLRSRTTHHSSN